MSSDKKYQVTKELDSAIQVLGDSWILSILCNLSSSSLRFNELQRAVNINPVTLTDRLKRLEHDGIIKREEETRDKLSVVYELTEKGRAILPIIREIKGFAERFYKE
jgi:DNA-binding HxlR family transcriptional regulator